MQVEPVSGQNNINHRNDMPYINVQITREGVTARQKREIIAGVTRLMQDVLDKDPQTTHVVIQEINPDNWGLNGQPKSELNAAKSSANA